jgi:hypothetical protein
MALCIDSLDLKLLHEAGLWKKSETTGFPPLWKFIVSKKDRLVDDKHEANPSECRHT